MSLFEKHRSIIENAVKANSERGFYAQWPEHPKPYGEEAPVKGLEAFKAMMGNTFGSLQQGDTSQYVGEEVSPFTQKNLGVQYPAYSPDDLIINSGNAWNAWKKVNPSERAGVLVECLEAIKDHFFEIAYATMHTSGQSFMMSFQASGPHSNDRALEALAMGWEELTRFPEQVRWDKPMGKFNVVLDKTFNPIPRGISLAIGCSTFPVWNTVPGIFAALVTGNTVIVKPHPKAALPIAIVIADMQRVLKENGYDPQTVQLAADSSSNLITKDLAEHPAIKMIDYTGSSPFGEYIESLDKVTFTEKAGVNSVIMDSVEDLDKVMQNLAFSLSLYSGQMCTAPQNFFIPAAGVKTADGMVAYDEVVSKLKGSIEGLVNHPKMGAGTLAAIQNEATMIRAKDAKQLTGADVVLASGTVANVEFAEARVCTPAVLEVTSNDKATYEKELFGPISMVIKTNDTNHSVALAKEMAIEHGAITCAAYSTDEGVMDHIATEMNEAFTPVSFNLTGFIWVNQHAAFSDFHVTGGNPAGNASFTNPDFVNRRFVWVGNRYLAK